MGTSLGAYEIHHKCAMDCFRIIHVCGLQVLLFSQTYLELNNFVMFQKSQYFEEPEKFKAERWLRDGSAQNINPFILTPFSHGPRMCIGKSQL